MVKLMTFAAFRDEHALSFAVANLKERKISVLDAYTPYPVHGLDELLGQRRSRLPVVCFVAASVGCLSSLWFQVWTSAQNWPINVGGKPMVSIPAFIPVTFEVTVLLGGLVTVAAFLIRSRLFPGRQAVMPHLNVTNDGFWLAVEHQTSRLDPAALRTILENLGGHLVRTEERDL